MKYFLTGGAGFIGSHITEYLLGKEETRKIVVYDNFSSNTQHNLNFINDKRLIVIKADLNSLERINESLDSDTDIVFHLAANPDISKAETCPTLDFKQGTILTSNLLEVLRMKKIKKLIYTSGSGVYGEKNIIFNEDYGPLIPISPYAANKIASEALISAYCHMFNITAKVFRFANVVGKRQTHGVGFDLVNKILKNSNEIEILGDGSQSKSYIHISDIIKAIFSVIDDKNNKLLYDIFNVATDDYITVSEIAKITLNCFNLKETKLLYTGGDRGWNGDVPKVKFNSNKIRNSYGWSNKYNSFDAITKSIYEIIDDRKNEK